MKPAIRLIRDAHWLVACWPVLILATGVGVSASQSPAPDAPPARWVGLIGEYGPDDDVWMVLEDESRLHLRQGEMAYPLE